ncbi:MAG: hypothetical protein ACXVCY_05750 [Pseudobdellovibrionaceae bacterium]
MKTLFCSILCLSFFATAAPAANLNVKISCESGASAKQDELQIKNLLIDLTDRGEPPMSGLSGYSGVMNIQFNKTSSVPGEVVVRAFPHWHALNFYGENNIKYNLATFSDIFDQMDIKRIGTLTLTNSDGWEKKFEVICSRVN